MNASEIANILSQDLGMPIIGNQIFGPDTSRFEFRPADLSATRGFRVICETGWKSMHLAFQLDSYAKDLLAHMCASNIRRRRIHVHYAQCIKKRSVNFRYLINGSSVDLDGSDLWPARWNSLQLEIDTMPLKQRSGSIAEATESIVEWCELMFLCMLPIMPIEEIDDVPKGAIEGTSTQVMVLRYERSHANRVACIALHGTRCFACGFDFQEHYGAAGSGYIEIHHLEMVSSLGPGKLVDPAIDLVPLCANCHAIAHRRTPPFSVNEIKEMLTTSRKQKS